MSGTRRTPLERRLAVQITPRAIDLFVAMSKLHCTCAPRDWSGKYWEHQECPGCERWYDLHGELNDALACEPWQWPCVARASPSRAGSTCWNEDIAARMAMLREAAKARRKAPPSSEKKEESPDVAEPVAGPGTPA
jgi:hypothetical protein